MYNFGLIIFSLLAWSPVILGGIGYEIFGIISLMVVSCLSLNLFVSDYREALRFNFVTISVFFASAILTIIVILSNLKSGAFPPVNDIIGYISLPCLLLILNATPFKSLNSALLFLSKGSIIYVMLVASSLYFGIGISVEKVSNIDRLTSNVGFNSLAFHLGAAGIFSMLALFDRSMVIRIIWILFVSYLISMTGSRTALVAFILSSFLCFSGEFKPHSSILFRVTARLFFILLLFFALAYAFHFALYRGTDEGQLDLLSGRTLIWFSVLNNMSYLDFFTGIGSDNIKDYINMGNITSTHNLYLQILAEAGIIGLLCLFIIVYKLFKLTMQMNSEYTALKGTLFFLFLNSFTESRYFGVGGIGSFVITFACVYILIVAPRKDYKF